MRGRWKQCYTLITEMFLCVCVCAWVEVSHHRNVRILCATKNKIGIKMKRHTQIYTENPLHVPHIGSLKKFLVFPKIAKWANNYVYGKQFSFATRKQANEKEYVRRCQKEWENGRRRRRRRETCSEFHRNSLTESQKIIINGTCGYVRACCSLYYIFVFIFNGKF